MKNKFKVWDIKNQRMIPPELIRSLNFVGRGDYFVVIFWNNIKYPSLNDEHCKIFQSTGLFDKNNKEIFEGDILFGETRNDPKHPTFTGTVEFHQPTASFLIRSEDGFTRGMNSLYNPEIRGNIYEKI
jgi:uncharacterized phage protein (TIGR01671 family)